MPDAAGDTAGVARTIDRCAQQSDEWKRLHIYKPTAANFHKILTPGGKLSEQRKTYMYRLLAEKLLNEHLPERPGAEERESKNYWMDRGIDMEPIAIKTFEQEHSIRFEPVGFVTAANGRMGCSPDGLIVGKNESVEIKAPAPWTQIKYLLEGLGTQYKPQVQGQLLVGGFDCVHFYAFHPRTPNKYVMTVPEFPYMATLRQALDDFLGELDASLQKARELGNYLTAEEIMNLSGDFGG
jgi:hypothetical protein